MVLTYTYANYMKSSLSCIQECTMVTCLKKCIHKPRHEKNVITIKVFLVYHILSTGSEQFSCKTRNTVALSAYI